MTDPQRITSRQNDRVKAVSALRDAAERRRTGLFIAEGMREVQRAMEAGLGVRDVFVCPQVLGKKEPSGGTRLREAASGVWYEVSESVLAKLAYRENPEGIVAVFEQPRWTFETIMPRVVPELWLVGSGLTKPGNVGAMARTALAAGATALIVTGGGVDAFNPNAIRASTGAVFTLPVVEAEVTRVLEFFAGRDVMLIAADPAAQTTYTDLDLHGPLAVVIGAEDTGLDPAWTKHSQITRAAIPTQNHSVDSLNASVAAAVFLFEALRQRSLPRKR